MGDIEDLVAQMRRNPKDVGFAQLSRVCQHFFGKPRQGTGSHKIYKTPWQGDPRVNIQSKRGKAKVYQVRQVLKAIDRLEAEHGTAE